MTSPSANIGEAENEQEVPPFKPMIIKSNSQAISGAYECNTTTKKSPKGEDLNKINALKESINSVSITAKLPSSTTNQSASGVNLKNSNSFHKSTCNQKDIFSNRKSASGYSNLGFGVGQGPIKISQKINMVNSSNKKNKGGNSTAQKSKNSQNARGTSSSQKMKISKSYIAQMQGNNTLRQNLSKSYKDKLGDQAAANKARTQSNQHLNHTQQQQLPLGEPKLIGPQRDVSCTSHNQVKTNAMTKQFSYISGQPKVNMGAFVYSQQQVAAGKNGYSDNRTEAKNTAVDTSSNAESHGGRSVLSIKNQVQVIKRKGSYHNQTIDLRININKANPGPEQAGIPIMQHVRGKNVPNGLLRRATGGNQGAQKSIGNLSCYRSMGNGQVGGGGNQSQNGNFDVISQEEAQKFLGIDSHSSGGKYSLPKNKSIEDFAALQGQQQNLPEGFFMEQKPKNTQVNPPAIIQKNKTSDVHHSGMTEQTSAANATKETLLKMTQERGIANQPMFNTRPHSSQRPSKT